MGDSDFYDLAHKHALTDAPETMESGRVKVGVERWIVDISKWNPSHLDFSSALSLLPQHDQSSITGFVRMEDRKRALTSRLLQYVLVLEVLGIPFEQIAIKRTAEGKPYLERENMDLIFPNFHFNVSHDGDYVVIAAEPQCLVGVDVVHCIKPQEETVHEFIQNFTGYFSSKEWDQIYRGGNEDEVLVEFYKHWCLKEAYVKATGCGLPNRLDKEQFHHMNWNDITLKIDGKFTADWKFWLFELPNSHWLSVAMGHPTSAAESYKRTLKCSDINDDDYHRDLDHRNVPFVTRTVEQLIHVLHSKSAFASNSYMPAGRRG